MGGFPRLAASERDISRIHTFKHLHICFARVSFSNQRLKPSSIVAELPPHPSQARPANDVPTIRLAVARSSVSQAVTIRSRELHLSVATSLITGGGGTAQHRTTGRFSSTLRRGCFVLSCQAPSKVSTTSCRSLCTGLRDRFTR